MGTISNHLPKVKTTKFGELSEKPKTLEQYELSLKSDFTVKKNNMIAEFRERENMMLAIVEVKLSEYEIISAIVNMNTEMNSGNPTPESMLRVAEFLSQINFDSAMRSMPLRIWEAELGKQFLLPVICDIVNYFIRQFKVKESVSGAEIMQYSIDLMFRNPELRIKELIMIFRDALSGKFGSTFQRIGIDTLYEWESKYFERAANHLESKVSSEKIGESRGQIAVDPMDERIKRYAEEVGKKKAISDHFWKREERRKELLENKPGDSTLS
jgi:hypothetical protein